MLFSLDCNPGPIMNQVNALKLAGHHSTDYLPLMVAEYYAMCMSRTLKDHSK